jgi:hypothetical protein
MAMRPATSRCVQRQYGLALIPEHGGDAAVLLTAADTGMYVSKRAGRTRPRSRWAAAAPRRSVDSPLANGPTQRGKRVNESTSRWWVVLTIGTLLVLLALVIHVSK